MLENLYISRRESTFKLPVIASVAPVSRPRSMPNFARGAPRTSACPPPFPVPVRCLVASASRDLVTIVYQWSQPHTHAVRINIIISKSKAGGPRPVSALLSFSFPLPSLRERRHALLLCVFLSSLPHLARSLCPSLSAGYDGWRPGSGWLLLPFLL